MAALIARKDLLEAQRRAWDRLGSAGTWLDGQARIAVAEATRHAASCRLCARRKAALSPYGIDGEHDGSGRLPASWVEVVHRIASDPGRLTQSWYRKMIASGIAEPEYVEIVSVIAHVVALDTFARGLGAERGPLPTAREGAPSRYRPAEARQTDAWVPTIGSGQAGLIDLVGGAVSNIRRALTLVPDEARSFWDLADHQYLSGAQRSDFSREYRAITHRQIELLAARVSAINQCTYCTTRHALLLRASSQHAGEKLDLNAITAAGARESGVAHGDLLIEFAEAVLGTDDDRLAGTRKALLEAMGSEALVDAAGVAGFFNAINRVADATGTPLDDKTLADTVALREELGINQFAAIRHAEE